MKNHFNGINSSLDTREDKNNKLENRSREIIQIGVNKEEKD